MSNFNGIVYLTEEQYELLKANGTLTVGDTTINFDENTLYVTDDDILDKVKTLENNVSSLETAVEDKSKILIDNNFVNTINFNSDPQTQILQLSNPNLLINGDFRVNQRGKTSYASTNKSNYSYAMDRWRVVGVVNIDVSDSGLYCSLASQWANLSYIFEDLDSLKLAGKQVTLSFDIENLTGDLTVKIRQNATNITTKDFTTSGLHTMTVTLPSSLTNFDIHFENNGTSTILFKLNWVKLEIGSVATAFNQRPYAEELAMCQRYYYKTFNNSNMTYPILATGVTNNNYAYLTITLPQTLRTSPTFSYGGEMQLFGGGDTAVANPSLTLDQFHNNMLGLKTSYTVSNGLGCILRGNNNKNAYISVDAEIY